MSVVIPLRDEVSGVAALAERMRCWLGENAGARPVDLVLVDDGSADGTYDLLVEHFAGLPYVALRHSENRGLTTALLTGSALAGGDYVAWLDSDLTYDPAVLDALAAALDAGADIAVASCYHPAGTVVGVPRWRRALSGIASRAYRRLSGAQLWTFTCMVRAYRREALAACWPARRGFAGVTEVLLRALRRGTQIAEVPARLHRRRRGQSKMRVLRVGLEHLGLLGWLWWSRRSR